MTLALGIGLVLTAWSAGTLSSMFGLLLWLRRTAANFTAARAVKTGRLADQVLPLRLRGPLLWFVLGWCAVLLVGVGLIVWAAYRIV
jgi:hypothetical protein